jgi:hypothetical protein
MNVTEPEEQARVQLKALSDRWQKRIDALHTTKAVETIERIDDLVAEDEDRERHRRQRSALRTVNEGGVLMQPCGANATSAMRGRRQQWSRRRQVDWPEDDQ